MGDTKIPYCDATWDLTIGCRKRSPGCEHCWAIRTVHRLACRGVPGYGFQTEGGDNIGRNWLRTSAVNLLERKLRAPLCCRKGRFFFVNSKSDLFDERVSFEFVAQAFNVMADARQHRYMVLTKEPERLAEFIDWYMPRVISERTRHRWPDDFPHVILMVSIEGPEYMHRWETTAAIPAALRGISFEPLLEPVSPEILKYTADVRCSNCGWLGFGDNETPEGGLAREYDGPQDRDGHWQCPHCGASEEGCMHDYAAIHNPFGPDPRPDWIIVGCEKLPGGAAGRGAVTDAWWMESGAIMATCRNAGVALWMKQGPMETMPTKRGRSWITRVTDDPSEFPPQCRIQQRPPWRVPL